MGFLRGILVKCGDYDGVLRGYVLNMRARAMFVDSAPFFPPLNPKP